LETENFFGKNFQLMNLHGICAVRHVRGSDNASEAGLKK